VSAVKFIFCCLILASLFLEGCYCRAQVADGFGGSDDAGISFQLSAGYLIVVEGRIENLNKLRFVLDTGATRSVVDRKIANRLRVPRRQSQRPVFSFDKIVTLEQGEFQDVQFGPVRVAKLSMLIDDLVRFSDFGRDVDVIVGMDLLGLSNFAIDYDSRKVLFSPPDHAGFGPVLESNPLFFTVKILIQDHPVNLVVDSGIEGVLLYENRLLENVPNLKIEGRTKPTGLGSRLQAKWATLPNLHIGTTNGETRVLLMNSPPAHILRGIDGYIGTASLGARRIAFNFTTKTLTLRREERASTGD
jgi:Aspartyl protease